jgi:rare lipoprotein A (peptidoglycan hydrolase)
MDRGPVSTTRDLDLSEAAFAALAPTSKGVIWVHWRVQ